MTGDEPEPENRPASGRDTKGRFTNESGNPHGRPRDVHGLAKLAREHGPELIRHLLDIARKGRGPARVAAIRELLDRGFGKPLQSIDVTASRGPDAALGGNPDAARRRIEEMIAAASAGSTDPTFAALPVQPIEIAARSAIDGRPAPALPPPAAETPPAPATPTEEPPCP